MATYDDHALAVLKHDRWVLTLLILRSNHRFLWVNCKFRVSDDLACFPLESNKLVIILNRSVLFEVEFYVLSLGFSTSRLIHSKECFMLPKRVSHQELL